MFGLFKNKISHKEVVNQYDNSDLIKAYNLIKESVPEYKEPNYALAEKVFQDFNSFQLKLTKEQSGPHLLLNLVPMSLLPYPKKYIKVAYYLYVDLVHQKAPEMVRNIEEISSFLFSSYPNYERYIDKLDTIRKVDESGLVIVQEKFEKLFGTKEISKEEYFAGAGSQECLDEKIKHDFGYLPNIEEDFDIGDILEEIQNHNNDEQEDEECDIEKVDNADISLAYKYIDAGIDISDHLDKFIGEKSNKLALKIIEADSDFGVFNVANNISHFSKLNQDIAKRLIEKDEAYCVGKNLDKFENLDQKAAELLIENSESDAVLENINKFFIKDESRLALNIIDSDSSLGAVNVAQALDKFTNLNQKVAENLVGSDQSDMVLGNISKFFITDESRLALKIIDSDSALGAFTIAQALDKFTNLNQKVAERLIENDESDTVLKNIGKFSIVDESQLALKIMGCGSDGTYLIIENFNKFKNLSKRVVSEIIKDKSSIDDFFTLSEELNSNIESFAKEAQAFIKETYPTD